MLRSSRSSSVHRAQNLCTGLDPYYRHESARKMIRRILKFIERVPLTSTPSVRLKPDFLTTHSVRFTPHKLYTYLFFSPTFLSPTDLTLNKIQKTSVNLSTFSNPGTSLSLERSILPADGDAVLSLTNNSCNTFTVDKGGEMELNM